MECPKCGWNNQEQARYCSHCGTALPKKKREKIFCAACGTPNKPDARFCRECGMELVRPVRNKRTTTRKKQQPQAVSPKGKTRSLALNLGVGAVVVLFLLAVFGLQNRSDNRPQQSPPAPVTAQDPVIEAQVIEVASHFRCSCGTCGGTPLDECACETAIEEKNFIRQKLSEGHKIPHVITMVDQTYGWLKPEYEKSDPKL